MGVTITSAGRKPTSSSPIRSARLFAKRKHFKSALQDLGNLNADEMFETVGRLGKGEGMKEAMGRDDVPPRVKAAMRSLLLCMSNVVGSNAHRTTLRHISAGFRNLFGAPLLFTTMNVADTKHVAVKLLYDGKDVSQWRLLEEDSPDLGPNADMLRRVAKDPVGQAIFSDLMMNLFLKHVVGVLQMGTAGFCDGIASSGQPGLFGPAQAYLAPLEAQGRGGLHAHMNVWIRNWLKSGMLEKLRSGSVDQAFLERLGHWRKAVLAKVATMQFDSVEEFGRQLHLNGEEAIASLPMSAERQAATFMDGGEEAEDAAVLPAPRQAFEKDENVDVAWRDAPAQGPARQRPLAPLMANEPLLPNPCSQSLSGAACLLTALAARMGLLIALAWAIPPWKVSVTQKRLDTMPEHATARVICTAA